MHLQTADLFSLRVQTLFQAPGTYFPAGWNILPRELEHISQAPGTIVWILRKVKREVVISLFNDSLNNLKKKLLLFYISAGRIP